MIKNYILSQEADNDIEDIFEYGEHHFGDSQAIEYLIGLNNHFKAIAQNPDIGKERKEIKGGDYSASLMSRI